MTIDERLDKLKAAVKAAKNEAVTAVMFHETWKPTAYDNDLFKRMGSSSATNSFLIIRSSLRREMLLALMRLWDSNQQAISMRKIRDELRNDEVFNALVSERGADDERLASAISDDLNRVLNVEREKIISLIEIYLKGGKGHATFLKTRTLRNEHLAHRQITPSEVPLEDTTDKDIELFYEDTVEIVRLLLSLVLGLGSNLSEFAKIYSHCAKVFWINARGERTEGHPNFHPPVPVVD